MEDSLLVAKFYRMALERVGGYQVACSEDVREILRLVSTRAVDAVMLDVSLHNCRCEGGRRTDWSWQDHPEEAPADRTC